MRSRLIAFLVAATLLVASATAAAAEGPYASAWEFPDDPGIPPSE